MLQPMLCMQGQRHEESDSQDDWTDEETMLRLWMRQTPSCTLQTP